jgi:membrane-bound serine protease (ClpP class)
MTSVHRHAIVRLTPRLMLVAATSLLVLPVIAQKNEAPPAGARAAVLTLKGEITDITFESLKRRIDEARAKGVDTIVLDMDTPGGYVSSSIDIADLIRDLTDIKTVAWVNPDAYSGGSLVAVACDEIIMSRSSRLGDAQVIFGGPDGASAVPEDLQPKVYTPVVHDFRMSAQLNGYSPVLCEAFVVPEREVWWLENTETGEREFVFRDEKIRRVGDVGELGIRSKPKKANKAADETKVETAGEGSDQPAEPQGDDTQEGVEKDSATDSKWKLVETYYDIVLQRDVPARQPVDADDELLQMAPGEAHAYGFCKALINNDDQLAAHYALSSLNRFDATWSEALALWLTSMPVRAFLLIAIFLGAYVEFHTPGVGLAGLVALIALAVFVGAPYLTGLASVWEIVMILLGAALLLLEIFVIPGFGVAGITGIFCILTGLIATFIPEQPGQPIPSFFRPWPGTVEGLKQGLIALVSAMAASLVGMVMLSKYLPKMPIFRNMVPANPMPSEVAVEDPYRGAAHVGDVGRTESMLRPAGKARFGSLLVDVVTQGDLIAPGTVVEVVERRGNRVVVRPVRTA